jgi:hypothetical protein
MWRFETVPNEYWEDPEHRKAFMEWLSKELNISQMDSWYTISNEMVKAKGGESFLRYYNHSLFKALNEHYPTVEWKPWKFLKLPVGYWKVLSNQRQFLLWVAKQLSISNLEDWYRVSPEDLKQYGGQPLLTIYRGSLINGMTIASWLLIEDKPYLLRFQSTHGRDGSFQQRRKVIGMISNTKENTLIGLLPN